MFKALGDPTRLRLLLALRGGEMCVCDLAAFLGSSESSVSHHLRHLRQLALVRRRREGQMLFYSLDDDHVEAILKIGLNHLAHSEGRSKR
jgi:DNA-binding transcriptional ArsR family regulator